MHLGAEIGCQRRRAGAPTETGSGCSTDSSIRSLIQRIRLAQQLDQLDRDARLALEMGQKVFPPQHEQFGRLARGGIRGAALAVEHRDLANRSPGPRKFRVRRLPSEAPVFDPDLAAPHPEQGVTGIAFLEQHLAHTQILGVAKARDSLQLVGAQVRETSDSSSK